MNNDYTKAVIDVANAAYPDGEIAKYYEDDDATGDGLAQFIVHEIKEVTMGAESEEEALQMAMRAMDTATAELTSVWHALIERDRNIWRAKLAKLKKED